MKRSRSRITRATVWPHRIWSENINRALEAAAKVKAGIVWINSTNLFDAAAGFGGYKESGFGREGGREGMYEYIVADWERALPATPVASPFAFSTTPAPAATGLAEPGRNGHTSNGTGRERTGHRSNGEIVCRR